MSMTREWPIGVAVMTMLAACTVTLAPVADPSTTTTVTKASAVPKEGSPAPVASAPSSLQPTAKVSGAFTPSPSPSATLVGVPTLTPIKLPGASTAPTTTPDAAKVFAYTLPLVVSADSDCFPGTIEQYKVSADGEFVVDNRSPGPSSRNLPPPPPKRMLTDTERADLLALIARLDLARLAAENKPNNSGMVTDSCKTTVSYALGVDGTAKIFTQGGGSTLYAPAYSQAIQELADRLSSLAKS